MKSPRRRGAAGSAVHAAWGELKSHLEARYRALHEEVRHYPTPIAHCDEQLPGLIEQRNRALAQLRRMGEDPSPAEDFIRDYVEGAPPGADDVEAELLMRLRQRPALTPSPSAGERGIEG